MALVSASTGVVRQVEREKETAANIERIQDSPRHCEPPSGGAAIQNWHAPFWIASSLTLLAMTKKNGKGPKAKGRPRRTALRNFGG
jgi:hypothetical protein